MAFARTQRPDAAIGTSIDLADFLVTATVVFVPTMAAIGSVNFMIKEVHALLPIKEVRTRVWTTALRSGVSASVSSVKKLSVPMSLQNIVQSFLGAVALIQRATRFHRSRLIVVDAKLARWSPLRCTQCISMRIIMISFPSVSANPSRSSR